MEMKNKKQTILFCAIFALIGIIGCNDDVARSEEAYIPAAPDYADGEMWCERTDSGAADSGADIFYVVSTWQFDWQTADGKTCHYADPVANATHRDNMAIEIKKIADIMGDGNRFYSPYYRHITLETWATLNEDTINNRYQAVSFVDVKNAFDYYLEHYNQGRPFVLAGFSQGGKSVVELIKAMPDDVAQRMIAAYVLGYKVTPQDTVECQNLRAAQDSIDLGVTICYNSVKDVKYIQPVISAPSAMCINPVNWRTDDTPAILHDTITVTVSQEHKVLVLEGYSGSEYSPILGFLNVGDVHSCEPWLYSECLRNNVSQRIEAYQEAAAAAE